MAGSRRLTALGEQVTDSAAAAFGDDTDPILVALSGGADSAVLAWGCMELGRTTRAAYVHHGWPGSDRLALAASKIGARLGLVTERLDVGTGGPGSAEEVARQARYAALGEVRAPPEWIATGHTLTDQAETVIGNLMWGSGLDGLAGIHARRGRIIRPILDVSRSRTRELATLLGLPYVDDPANEDATYRRVRIRRALADWEARLAPGLADRIAQTAQLVRVDIDLLNAQSEAVTIEEAGSAVRIPAGALRAMDDALARRVVRRALRLVGQGHPGTRADVAAVMAVAFGGPAIEVSGGHRVTTSGASVQIGTVENSSRPGSSVVRWALPGRARWQGWTWTATEHQGRPDVYPLSPWIQLFDTMLFEAGQTVIIRAVAADDLVAMGIGHKPAGEAMAEAGIPAADRPTWPALDLDGSVVWIPGVRRASLGWVTAATQRYLVVSAAREERWKPVEY